MAARGPLQMAWRAGRQILGVWCMTPGTSAAELIAAQGVDYVCIDQQHGLLDYASVAPMAQAITAGGAWPISRVAWNEPAEVMRTLDAGVLGVIVPMVNDAEEAARAVAASRFPPEGTRSYGPVRATAVFGSAEPDELTRAALIVMVETAAGLANLEAIVATAGVDAVYIGPSDLALALGLAPATADRDRRWIDAVEAVRAACARRGIAVGMHCADGETARRYLERGFHMVTIGSDAGLLTSAVRRQVTIARRADESAPTTGRVWPPT